MRTLDLSEFPSSGELQKTKVRPTRMEAGRLSLSHTFWRTTPKSCPGFADGGGVSRRSPPVPEPCQEAQLPREFILADFWPESKEEVRS